MSLYDELLHGDEITNLPTLAPLIDGVLDLNSTALLYGASGVGKSAVALDWGLSVASGADWDGHLVTQGQVLYVLGEGLSGTHSRYSAWCTHHEQPVADIWWAKRAPNILEYVGREELYECARKLRPVLVLLDTVARHIPGGDENSFETMSLMVEVLDRMKVESGGACAVGIHHSGKDESAGARGHSSLRGAVDTEIHCTDGPILTVKKQKNHGDGYILGSYELLVVNGSVVLNPKVRRSTPNDDMAVRALSDLGGAAAYGEWRRVALALGVPVGSFDRTLKRLASRAIVERDGGDGDGAWKLPSP